MLEEKICAENLGNRDLPAKNIVRVIMLNNLERSDLLDYYSDTGD